MTTAQAFEQIQPVIDQCEADSDAMVVVYFSRSDDRFDGRTIGMDAGDALMVINQLAERFGLTVKVDRTMMPVSAAFV